MPDDKASQCIAASEWPFILADQCTSLLLSLTNRLFHHMNYGQRDVAFQRDFQPFHGNVSSLLEKFCSCQRSSHFKARKAGRAGPRFASIQQQGTNSLTCPVRMDKECADLRSIGFRIKQIILAISPAITAVKRFSFTPAATGNNHRFLL